MLAMSSTSSSSHYQPTNPFLATNLGGGSSSSPWPLLLEDPFLVTTNYHHQHSLLDTHFVNSPPPPLPFIDLPPESFAGEDEQVVKKDSSSSGGGTVITTMKKLNHNASERHRRKKINTLYSSLRSMLPPTDHHPTKKLSIPNTVSRVLKYIPELQQQVEALERKKKELLSAISNDKQLDNNKQDGHVDQSPNIILGDHHHRKNLDTTKKSFTSSSSSSLMSSSSTVSTSWLGEQEVMVQISIAQNDNKSNVVPHRTFPVSEVLLHLKETGLVLVNSSSFESCRGRVFYNLHLQVEGTRRGVLVGLDSEALSEKLLNLYEQATARSS
ncbi:unnamed protein product [Linum trigynum]|uniref:BHLH domain-containing protein n=1 Tax=Linum trigynum TaxID=586398 RepID=A0AAV2C7S3_9ROSI